MSNDVPSVLLAAAAAIAGLALLRFASRNDDAGGRREIGFPRGLLLMLAALLLVALPVAIWIKPLLEASAPRAHRVSPGEIFLLAGYLDAAVLWLIWNINSYAFRAPGSCNTPWEENWGATYSPELKQRLLGPVLAQLEMEGKIGGLIVDVGSGAMPVSQWLPAQPDRRFIHVDIAAKRFGSPAAHYLRFDAESIGRPDLLGYKKALVEVGRFLGIDARAAVRAEHATAMIFSDILNYVDFRNVIEGFAQFLQPGGRIIIVNLPTRGIQSEFSEKGLKRNEDLYAFLAEQNLDIEFKDFPCRPVGETDESEEMIVLVARKARGALEERASESHESRE